MMRLLVWIVLAVTLLSAALRVIPIAPSRVEGVAPTSVTLPMDETQPAPAEIHWPDRETFARLEVETAPIADAPPTPGPALAPRPVLLGIVEQAGLHRAWIRLGEGQAIQVQPGTQVGGWTVVVIEPTRLIMRREGEETILGLFGAAERGN